MVSGECGISAWNYKMDRIGLRAVIGSKVTDPRKHKVYIGYKYSSLPVFLSVSV